MTKFEESHLSSVNAVDDPHDRRSAQNARSPSERQSKSLRLGITALVVIQTIFIIALISMAIFLRGKLNASQAFQQTQAIAAKEIAEKTRTLQTEVTQIRQFLSSTSAENVIFLKMMTLAPDIEPKLGAQIARAVHRYGTLYGQDPNLILSIMFVESKFNPNAVSSKGAVGLMQIMPQWKKVLGISEDLRDPDTSIKYGMQIYGFYHEMYRETETALIAYNRGPGPVDMALMKGRDPNNGYPDKVLATYDKLKAMNVGSL